MCDQCGAPVAAGASCAERFDLLLALDQSRAEPWGSRHALAFAAFTLQHTRDASAETVQRCLEVLHRVCTLGEDTTYVANSLRSESGGVNPPITSSHQRAPDTFAFTIDDMGDFAGDSYAERLDAWCRATLAAWMRTDDQ